MYNLKWQEKALEELYKLDKGISARIFKKVEEFKETSPFSFDVIKLKGYEDWYRLRVGDYRVIFSIDGEKIIILKVGHRKDVYNKL